MPAVLTRSIVVLLVVVSVVVAAAPAAAQDGGAYSPPVDAPISEPFRPPATATGPGNRGLESPPAPGAPVVAAADGSVTCGGVVAGQRWVTLRHADGVRT